METDLSHYVERFIEATNAFAQCDGDTNLAIMILLENVVNERSHELSRKLRREYDKKNGA